jgi:hypothetical protein
MTVVLKTKPIGRHKIHAIDDEPREEKPATLTQPCQRLRGLRKASEGRRLRPEERSELANLEREFAKEEARAQDVQKRRKLKEQIASDERRRRDFRAADDRFNAVKDALEVCSDEERPALLMKRREAFIDWDRSRSRLPELVFGVSPEEQLIALASPATKARLKLSSDARLYYQNRVAGLRDPLVSATPEEIEQAKEMFEAATLEYRLWRQRAIDE